MSEQPMDLPTLQKILDDIPFHQMFDLTILPCEATDKLRMHMKRSPAIERNAGTGQIHGGVLSCLGDIAGSFVIGRMIGVGGSTMHLSIDYLRPAVNTDVTAEAKVRRLGRTAGFVDIDIVNDEGELVAACRGIFGISRK